MKQNENDREIWLDLSDAAEYLGVHFTTLRRWADAGQILYIRTPGKRRRFSLKALQAFLQHLTYSGGALQTDLIPLQERAIDHTRENIRNLPLKEGWLARIDANQRARMKGTGHLLMALLLQYNTHAEGSEAFLDEGKRIMRDYSQICASTGLSLQETVRIFLFFRSSILDAVHETGYLGGGDDHAGRQLYQRSSAFLDTLIIELIDGYQAILSHPK